MNAGFKRDREFVNNAIMLQHGSRRDESIEICNSEYIAQHDMLNLYSIGIGILRERVISTEGFFLSTARYSEGYLYITPIPIETIIQPWTTLPHEWRAILRQYGHNDLYIKAMGFDLL